MTLAVVIPCLNAAHCVGRQLAALARQNTRLDWELIIVDDGSTDDLAATVDAHRHALPAVRVVTHPERRGTGAARNTGARATTAGELLFLDADDEIADGYLDAMAAALRHAALVTASIDYTRLNPPQVLRRTPADQLCEVLTASLFLPHVLGGLMGMTRALFDEIGGFDDALPALADLDVSWRAQLAGHSIGLADTVVSVGVRATHRSRLRRARFQGADIVGLRSKFTDSGVEPVGWAAHAAGWAALLTLLPRAVRPVGRSELVWEFGWQLGVLGALLAARRPPAAVRQAVRTGGTS
ncbi:glycosyltransferase family 2 protein [Streptomyces sp. NPDC054863]